MENCNTPDLSVHAQKGPRTKNSTFRAYIRKQLKALSESQEALADAREALLLERSAFRSRGEQVKAQRFHTGNAEIAFMNALREFCNGKGPSLPSALLATYDAVQQERDKLGSLEADYFVSEESLGSKEWEFLEEENDFYQYDLEEVLTKDIPEDFGGSVETEPQPSQPQPFQPPLEITIPSVFLQYQEEAAKHSRLMHQFNALRPEQAERIDRSWQRNSNKAYGQSDSSEDSEFTAGYMHLLDQTMECEVKVQQLKQDLMQHNTPGLAILFPSLDILDSREIPLQQPLQKTPHLLLDGSPPDSTCGLPIRDRLLEWLLCYLKGGAIERLLFSNTLQGKLDPLDINQFLNDSWECLATRYWLSDMTTHLTHPGEGSRMETSRSSQKMRSDARSYCQTSQSQRSSVNPDENGNVHVGDDMLAGALWPNPNIAESSKDNTFTTQRKPIAPPDVYSREIHCNIGISRENEDKSNTQPKILLTRSISDITPHDLQDGRGLMPLHSDPLEILSGSNAMLQSGGTGALEETYPLELPQHEPLDAPSSLRHDSCHHDSDNEESQRRMSPTTDDRRENNCEQICTIEQEVVTDCPTPTVQLEVHFNSLGPVEKAPGYPLEELETAASTQTASQTATRHITNALHKPPEWETPPLIGLHVLQPHTPTRANSVGRSSRPRKSDPGVAGQLHIPPQHRRSNSASAIYGRIGMFQTSFSHSMEHTLQAR